MAAKLVLTQPEITIATVDRSDEVKSASLPISAATLDSTVFASAGWREVEAGVKSADLGLEIVPLSDASGFNTYLRSNFGSKVAFTLKAKVAADGAENPKATGTILLNSLLDVGGQVNELATQNVSFPISGAIAWDVTP